MTQLVDDRVLSGLLRGDSPPHPGEPVYTTGYWYVRLCQAALSSTVKGSLSGLFADLPPNLLPRAVQTLLELPDEIGLLSLRTLAPIIGRLRSNHPKLNLLSLEALAAALYLNADVYLLTRSPPLEEALATEGHRAIVIE